MPIFMKRVSYFCSVFALDGSHTQHVRCCTSFPPCELAEMEQSVSITIAVTLNVDVDVDFFL